MRYAQMRSMDISNGEGIGVSLFVQGCPFHCKGCFNPETWDFNGGREWTETTKATFLELAKRPFVQRVSILGGEPLCNENCHEVILLCKEIKETMPEKKIWIYSGFTYEEIMNNSYQLTILFYSDILVDGRFRIDKQDFALKFRGSSNQRVIDVPNSICFGRMISKQRRING